MLLDGAAAMLGLQTARARARAQQHLHVMQQSDAIARMQAQSVSYMSGGACYYDGAGGGNGGAGGTSVGLEQVPELVDRAQAFVARQLVQRAQADYQAARDRADALAAQNRELDRARMAAEEVTRSQIAELERVRGQLHKLQPELRAKLMSPLFASTGARRVQYEPTPLWLASSIALVLAGLAMVIL